MDISTLAKILGISINDLRSEAGKNSISGFHGRNTRIPYSSAIEITKLLRPEKAKNLENDDKIYLPTTLTPQELADAVSKPPGMVVRSLVMSGIMVTLNEKIDFDTASLIASELGVEVFPENSTFEKTTSVDIIDTTTKFFNTNNETVDTIKLSPRPPIVTVMGHVDHGKTTLLDTIRDSNVAGGEAGAITQHISTYQTVYAEKKITFVDTPGHEAFTAMRARGSQLADFIILVVAATEGPKPQTLEVIERAKITKTPVIVAMNKIDLPESDLEKTKSDIAAFGLVPEEWGGDVPFIPISAKNNTNIDKLLDTVLLFAEINELKGQSNCPAQMVIIESHLDSKLGVVTTALVIKDTLRTGDIIQTGPNIGKVKKLSTTQNIDITEAEVAMPVIILGLPAIVNSGEIITVHDNQKLATQAANLATNAISMRKIFLSKESNDSDTINVILKADVIGSLEALKESILKVPQEKIKVIVKSEQVGLVTQNDIDFAITTKSTILAFHTALEKTVVEQVRSGVVNILQSNIIYEIIQWVEEEILKNTKYDTKIEVLGNAQVLAVFSSDKPNIQVFGGEVKNGKLFAGKMLQLIRDGQNLGQFEIVELQRNKAKTSEVNISQQFGISVKGKAKIQKGDIIESIEEIVLKPN